jgi:hypothetical protein
MCLRILIALAVLIGQSHPQGARDQSTPYGPYTCNLAKVYKIQVGKHLSVRSQPSNKSPRIDQLEPKAFVYICDETYGWYKVFYGESANGCGTESPTTGLDVRQTRTCKSGWVSKKWIDVISG